MNSDLATTISGGVVAAGMAANTILGQLPAGTSMHLQDYISLGMSIAMALWGFFTNRQKGGVNNG